LLLTRNPSQGKRQILPQSERLKKNFQANGLKKQVGVAILISNKIDFKPKVIKKDKEGHFILIEGKILQDEFSILTLYAPNARASTFIKETIVKLKAHIAPHTVRPPFGDPYSSLGSVRAPKEIQKPILL
jgi:exonuclease III